jgi:hypothetical protein
MQNFLMLNLEVHKVTSRLYKVSACINLVKVLLTTFLTHAWSKHSEDPETWIEN